MEIIDEVIDKIIAIGDTGGGRLLAMALASACNSHYKVSLLDISVKLDADNKRLVMELANISQHGDYSNAAQTQALAWLKENKLI